MLIQFRLEIYLLLIASTVFILNQNCLIIKNSNLFKMLQKTKSNRKLIKISTSFKNRDIKI